MRRVMLGGMLAACLLACCSSGNGTSYDFCTSSTEVIFEPGGDWLLPFPSDFYLVEDASTPGGHRINLDAANTPSKENMFDVFPFMREQLDLLDGFGTSASVTFGFTGEIGTRVENGDTFIVTPPDSLAIPPGDTLLPGTPAVLIDIDTDSPGQGRAVPLIIEYLSDRDSHGHAQHYLLCEPAFALRPKTTYALALTTRLTDKSGRCLAPSAGTRSLLTKPGQDEFGLLGKEIPAALEALTDGGFIENAGDLSALTVFTTQSIEEELLAATRQILSSDPPEIVAGSLQTSPGSEGVALVVSGKFTAADYQTQAGTFEIAAGSPVHQGTAELEFELLIPETTAEHGPPFPIVIYQHGLLGQKDEDRGAKRAQARAGFASLAIDAVLHGSRKADSGWEVTNFFGIDLDSGTFDMPLLRDNFRQSFLDIVSLAELADALASLDLLPEGAPDGVPELMSRPVYLSGHSLGGIIAAGAIALSPRIAIANLSAGGGSLPTNLFMRSDIFGTFIDMLRPEDTSASDVSRFMPILQILTERGDPVNLARLAIDQPPDLPGAAPKHVLFQEVIDDTFVPNSANEALARALGLAHLRPVLREVYGLSPEDEPMSRNNPQEVTAGFFQFDLLSNGDPAEHTEIYADPLAQAQWIHFFETFRDSGVPELVDPYRVLGIDRP
ncbi:MAG TPA: hypothetical protein VM425_19430 [Myxococcota bacterium]|nr:hypothetical protein [Myxococcota bacterium]